jgi:hypothetical protein
VLARDAAFMDAKCVGIVRSVWRGAMQMRPSGVVPGITGSGLCQILIAVPDMACRHRRTGELAQNAAVSFRKALTVWRGFDRF